MHEAEYCKVMEQFFNLQLLKPYNMSAQLLALMDASTPVLGYILFQCSGEGYWSILAVESTCLKDSQPCSAAMELELLAVHYMLTKSHYFTANMRQPIVVYSDCSRITRFQKQDLPSNTNKRMLNLKVKMSCYNYQIRHLPRMCNKSWQTWSP